ncbi:hypothetical protein [Sphingomonas sp. LaA6.9]|uniref:hypothetical protein n=1 Tax=Sphingomonas sp. LaA6.9 TaxID=2919914 RepID=UPI001F4FEE31|nr:hypothetical protein [Sphingomonas sp. LaA6.9]MCJ8159567.1 hypothetical protein [Sphingomonas sp. LaA6.9]
MEPLSPKAREQLKRANPGLTDDDIERYQSLTSRRFTLDPQRAADEIRRIDLEREELLRSKMPDFANIVNAVRQASRSKSVRKKQPPRVTFR